MALCRDCDYLNKHDKQEEGFFSVKVKYYCTQRREYVSEVNVCNEFKAFPKVKSGPVDGNTCKICRHFYVEKARGFFDSDKYFCRYQDCEVSQTSYCRGFERNPDDCYLTTACVTYYGKADDCDELTTLRRFRDSHLKQTDEGKRLVEEYYEVAPRIVKEIEASQNKDAYYQYIYGVITECVRLISQNEFEAAKNEYMKMTKSLKDKLLVS